MAAEGQRTGRDQDPDSVGFTVTGVVTRWTFENADIRAWVEEWLQDADRVLNACAGQSHLDIDAEVVRNDKRTEDDDGEPIPADFHVDVADLADLLEAGSFDAVVFDPPFSIYQSNRKYQGETVGHARLAKEGFDRLLRPGGLIIELGYSGSCMPARLNYTRRERWWFNVTGRNNDVLGSVDKKTQRTLGGGPGGD